MPNSIEIFENTLLQLITRQGTDNDRKEIILKSGELGYTTDTKRLFVGDGSNYGGNVVGNKFKGATVDLTTLGSGFVGDLAYKIGEDSLYVILSGDGTKQDDWSKISAKYSPANGSINITTDNKISVLSLSAGTISNDLMGKSMTLDSTNKITLSSTIATNSIETHSTQYLKFPEYLNINSINYDLPIGELGNNKYLKTNIFGKLSWSALGANASYFVYNSGGILPVGTIISTLTATTLNDDWIICNGQLLQGVNYPELSAVIGTRFGGNNATFRVPNLNNYTLYGTSGNFYDATRYAVASATSTNRSILSAIGVNYFIKAKPDKKIKSTLTVNTPLNITVNGSNANDVAIPALTAFDSDIVISVPESRLKVSSPLTFTKKLSNVTGSHVSIFDGDLEISGLSNTLKVNSPLKLTAGANDETGNAISPYTQNLNLELNTKNKLKANSPFTLKVNGVEKTGIDINLDTPNQNISLDLTITAMGNFLYPVGTVLFTTNNSNPQNIYGGTWVQISKGRFVVGVGTGTDINGESKTYANGNDNIGEYSHKLTIAETPSHNHIIPHSNQIPGPAGGGFLPQFGHGTGDLTSSVGGDQYHNNVPPGCGLYVWERTALA